MSWILFWKIIFISVLSAFAVMTVLTIFLGAKDVRELLRGLRSSDEDDEQE